MSDASQTDRYFATRREHVLPFAFNSEVAEVFDDMVTRSVPLYRENQQMMVEFLSRLLVRGDRIYDLGCSTGAAMLKIASALRELDLSLVGIDHSGPMVEKARLKLRAFGHAGIDVRAGDITSEPLEECGAVVMNYTLQFLPLNARLPLLRKIHGALRPGGALYLSEKIQADNPALQPLLTDVYYAFKRHNGYSELEISQKREALENVLVPLDADAQRELLAEAGFHRVETVLRWGPFATFLALKA